MTLDLPLFRSRRGRGGGGAGCARCGTGGRAGDALRCREPGFLLAAHLGAGSRRGWELRAPWVAIRGAGPGEGSAGSRGGRRQSGGGSMERCSPPAAEQEAVEAWLDDHGDFTRSYFVRKATR